MFFLEEKNKTKFIPSLQFGKSFLVLRPVDQHLQELMQRLRRGLRVASIRVHVQRTLCGWIVEQQHTRDNVFGLHGARDGTVCYKVLRVSLRITTLLHVYHHNRKINQF